MTSFNFQEIQKKLAILIQEGNIGEMVVRETLIQAFGDLINRLAREILAPHRVPEETMRTVVEQVFLTRSRTWMS